VPPASLTAGRRYARFLTLAVATAIALCLVGFLPTRRLAGPGAVEAMVAGCGISLVSAALAGWMLVAQRSDAPQARLQRGLLAMIVRLTVVLVFGTAAALSEEFARSPLLFWMATAYVALLPLEVRLAIL